MILLMYIQLIMNDKWWLHLKWNLGPDELIIIISQQIFSGIDTTRWPSYLVFIYQTSQKLTLVKTDIYIYWSYHFLTTVCDLDESLSFFGDTFLSFGFLFLVFFLLWYSFARTSSLFSSWDIGFVWSKSKLQRTQLECNCKKNKTNHNLNIVKNIYSKSDSYTSY